MHALITDNVHPILIEKLSYAGIDCEIDTLSNRNRILDKIPHFDILVVRSKIIIDKDFLNNARHLKCIARVGAGMETIDVDYAQSLGIPCLNSPEGNRTAVGEHAVALLLALFDHIARSDAQVRSGSWNREANRGIELSGRTVGIIGFGNMGAAFAQRLQGFDCRIIAFDKYKPAGYAPHFVEEVSLSYLQQHADVLSLHVPLTPETHYMVNNSFINSFSHPFFLINTARGAVVNTAHLVEALKHNIILGAALDVIEYEDMTRDGIALDNISSDFQWLLHSDRTVLTPHVAGWTVESKVKLSSVLADKIIHTCFA